MTYNYTVIDFESYYASKQGYTLKKMTPPEYILDPRFECTGASVVEGDDGKPRFYEPEELREYFKQRVRQQRAGHKIIMVSHNALFDMCLLIWRYGVVPDLMICTMSMAQALLYPRLGYVSLAKVSEYLGLKAKGDTIMHVDGMTRAMIKQAGLWPRYMNYAVDDAIICRDVFKLLRQQLPREEYHVMDMVIRCAAKPKFKLNTEMLYEHLEKVRNDKEALLASVGLNTPDGIRALRSDAKFAALLEERGIDPPMKVSPTDGEFKYAFAKSDQGMADLLEHDDPEIQALAAARVGVKTTLEESRTLRLIAISEQQWLHDPNGGRWAPMPLKYAGAHTHRLSGQWKINVQNFPRGGRLRDCLEAPPGYVVIVCDASQIEARIAAWLADLVCGVYDGELVRLFAEGADVYLQFAIRHIYKRHLTKNGNPKERFVGKQAILGLGFGMGFFRYMIQVRKDSRLQLKEEITLTEDESRAIVNGYRRGMAPTVPKAWKILNDHIPDLFRNSGFQFGPMTFGQEEVTGPTGLKLFYPEIGQKFHEGKYEWRFRSGRMHKRLFGGKFYENMVQHLARCCNIEAALKIKKHYGVELALQAHDELVYCVPGSIEYYMEEGKQKYKVHGFASEFMQGLHGFMSERPTWGRTLPLAAEAGAGLRYGDAK